MERKESLDNSLASKVSSRVSGTKTDLHPEKDTTLGDGNCAFNAFALGLCDLILADKLPENKIFYEVLKDRLNLTEANAKHFKEWLDTRNNTQRQQELQKILRDIAVQEIKRHYDLCYRTCYQEELWTAYEHAHSKEDAEHIENPNAFKDDTFITHTHIKEKFKEKLRKEELMQWWETIDETTGKSGKDIYFNNIQNSARHAEDYERWGGSPEFNALAIFFKINIEWIKGNPSQFARNTHIPMLGIGGGLIKDLMDEEKLLLRDLGLGDHFGNDFMVKAFHNHIELQKAMNRKREPYYSVLRNYIQNISNEHNIDIPQNIGDLKITEEVKSILLKWGILINKHHFMNVNGRLEKTRILNRLDGVNPDLKKEILNNFITPPKFRLQNTGQHWVYSKAQNKMSQNTTLKDKDAESKSSKEKSNNDFTSLSTTGLFKDVSRNLVEERTHLDKKHQAMIDAVFQRYYIENIYNIEDGLEKDPPNPWQFGYIDYLQAGCCGKIFKKEYLAKTSVDGGCPACKSLDIEDQLFCMYLKLAPRSTADSISKDSSSTLSLRAYLTLTLFAEAIKNKRYFLLEHLLLMIPNKPYINYHNVYGKTLLHYAIEYNDIIAVLILIKHGANTNALCRFLFRPIDYVDHLSRFEKNASLEDVERLKTILKAYGGLSSHETYWESEIYSGNNTLSQEGTRLHYACKRVDEYLVYSICRDEVLDVNATNSSNHTPLSMLAYFGNMEPGGNSVSIIYFLNVLLSNNIKQEVGLDVLLRLHELSYVASKHEYLYYPRECKFNLIDEILSFFYKNEKDSRYFLNIFHAINTLRLHPKSKSDGYFLCPKVTDWNSSKTSLYENDDFEKTIPLWLDSNKEVTFSGKLIIPCQDIDCIAIAVLTIKRDNNKTEISVLLNNLRGDKASFFLKSIELWVQNTFKCSPSFPKNQNCDESLVTKTRLEIVLNAIYFISHQVEYNITSEECSNAYLSFRLKTPLYLNEKNQDKTLFSKVMDDFKLNSDLIEKLLKTTRQDHIIRLLIAKNADVGIQSLFPNVFSVALRNFNYRFVETLIELGITPFAQEKTDRLIKKLPYNFHSTAILLYLLSKFKYGSEKAILHYCVSLIDGDTGVFLSEFVSETVKTPDLNLIEAFLSDKWKHPPFLEKLCGKHLLEVTNENFETPIFSAIRSNNLAAVKILIKKGASLRHKNKDGDYPIELFTRKSEKEKGRACYVISHESPLDIKELWVAVYGATHKQMSRDHDSIPMQDFARLNEKDLIESVIKKNGSFEYIIVSKIKEEFQDDDNDDEELESEEEIVSENNEEDNDNDEVMEPEEKAADGNDSDEDMEHQETVTAKSDEVEEHGAVKHFNLNKKDLLLLFEKQLEDLDKITQNNRLLPQDFTSTLTTLLLALQLIIHLDGAVEKKKEAKLLALFNTLAQQSFKGFLLQALLTIGPIRVQWRNGFLSSLASFLRGNVQEKTNEQGLMISFLCNFLQTDKEDDASILECYISDSIRFSAMKNSAQNCEQLLSNNIGVFTQMAHKMGICCMTDITPLLPKKLEEIPAKEAEAAPLTFSSKRKKPPSTEVGEEPPKEPASKKQKVVT